VDLSLDGFGEEGLVVLGFDLEEVRNL